MQNACTSCKDFMQMRFETLQLEHLAGVTALLPPRLLAAARSLMCIVCVIIIAFDADGSIRSGQTFGRWLSFLTSWTWVLCLSVLFPGLCYSLYFLKNPPSSSTATSSTAASAKDCNLLMRTHWVMWEMAATLSVTITILYWALVYRPGNTVRFSSVGVHGLNALVRGGAVAQPHHSALIFHCSYYLYWPVANTPLQFLISDAFLSGLPVVGSHFIFPILFAICYMIFSIIYILGSGAEPNYTVLTWTSGASVLYCFLALILIMICFCILCTIQRFRDYLVGKLRPARAALPVSTFEISRQQGLELHSVPLTFKKKKPENSDTALS